MSHLICEINDMFHFFYRSWYWIRFWFAHHWLCQKSQLETATFLICHLGICFVRSHGSVLSYDGLLTSLRLLNILVSSPVSINSMECYAFWCVTSSTFKKCQDIYFVLCNTLDEYLTIMFFERLWAYFHKNIGNYLLRDHNCQSSETKKHMYSARNFIIGLSLH